MLLLCNGYTISYLIKQQLCFKMIFVTMKKLIYSFTTRGNGRGHTFSESDIRMHSKHKYIRNEI